MDAKLRAVVSIDEAYNLSLDMVGGKVKNTAICSRLGFAVPKGFCITTRAYREFVMDNKLYYLIDKEVTRKPLDTMRWEEIWDSAFRIRSYFMNRELSEKFMDEVKTYLDDFDEDTLFSVRSSSVEEDSKTYSFAGIHESFVNVPREKVFEKIKLVWASLWSNRSLLYNKEKELDSSKSGMAVLIQAMEKRDISGLAFTRSPIKDDEDTAIIEAIRGSLNLLVDNIEEPERVRLKSQSGEVISHINPNKENILREEDISNIYGNMIKLESAFKGPVDVEWTGLGEDFTILQVRPITSLEEDPVEERKWYLTLTPSGEKLVELADRVENQLIPDLKRESEKYGKVSPEGFINEDFLRELKSRGESYEKWAKIYWDDFIPFAHGIRNFGVYYNDLMKPSEAYEFVELIKSDDLLAYKRNAHMNDLAKKIGKDERVRKQLTKIVTEIQDKKRLLDKLSNLGEKLADEIIDFLEENMDIGYEGVSLEDRPDIVLNVILSLAQNDSGKDLLDEVDRNDKIKSYLEVAKSKGILEEAEKWLKIGRISWKLRDDDNILLGRLENQLLLFMKRGIEILDGEARIGQVPEKLNPKDWEKIYEGIQGDEYVVLKGERGTSDDDVTGRIRPRQLLGQPSSSGMYTGSARVIRAVRDFKDVKRGEVLVFDAVQPQMTFIISLAGAIIERRGGMLVHSSIIARELQIPSVNGVTDATKLIRTGDKVTVNGDLGIVTIRDTSVEKPISSI